MRVPAALAFLLLPSLAGCLGGEESAVVLPWPRAGASVTYEVTVAEVPSCPAGADTCSVSGGYHARPTWTIVGLAEPARGPLPHPSYVQVRFESVGTSRLLVDLHGFAVGNGKDCAHTECDFLRVPEPWAYASSLFMGRTLTRGADALLPTPTGTVQAKFVSGEGDRVSYDLDGHRLTFEDGNPFAVSVRALRAPWMNATQVNWELGSGAELPWKRTTTFPPYSCATGATAPFQEGLPPGADQDGYALGATTRELVDAARAEHEEFDQSVETMGYVANVRLWAEVPERPLEEITFAHLGTGEPALVEVRKHVANVGGLHLPPRYEVEDVDDGQGGGHVYSVPFSILVGNPFEPSRPVLLWSEAYPPWVPSQPASPEIGYRVGAPLDLERRPGLEYQIRYEDATGPWVEAAFDGSTGCLLRFDPDAGP